MQVMTSNIIKMNLFFTITTLYSSLLSFTPPYYPLLLLTILYSSLLSFTMSTLPGISRITIVNGIFTADWIDDYNGLNVAINILKNHTYLHLHTIRFTNCYLNGLFGGDFLAVVTSTNFPINSIKEISFRDSCIVNTTDYNVDGVDRNFVTICKSLTVFPNLTHLDLAGCEIDRHRIPSILHLLENHLPKLSTIDLSGNSFTRYPNLLHKIEQSVAERNSLQLKLVYHQI